MKRIILALKLRLLVTSIIWAIFAGKAFLFLAQVFPSTEPVNQNMSELLASLQGYAIVFGPLASAGTISTSVIVLTLHSSPDDN